MKQNVVNKTALPLAVFLTLLFSCKKDTGFLPPDEHTQTSTEIQRSGAELAPEQAARAGDLASMQTETTTTSSLVAPQGWRQFQKSPIAFKRFEMVGKNGTPIPPNQLMTLKTGKQVTAQSYFNRLNNVEQKLNAQGFSLRNNLPVVASETVTESEYLDGMINQQPQPIRDLRTDADLDNFMKPVRKVGNVLLKPMEDYSAAEKKTLANYDFSGNDENLTASFSFGPTEAAPIPGSAVPVSNVLKTINATDAKEWSFGKASTFKATVRGELIRYARIYRFDPQNPEKTMSEFKVTGKGKINGSLFNNPLSVFNAEAEFFAPADQARNMTAKVKAEVLGINILNVSKSYAQKTTLSDTKSRRLNKAFNIEVPIVPGVDFAGKIGVSGTASLNYSATLGRAYVSAKVVPSGNLKGYSEAGVEFLDLVGGGVGGELVFVEGKLDLRSSIFIALQDAKQIVAGYSYYFGYDLTMLKGRLYCYIEACVPLTGWCYRAVEHNFFSWSGYAKKGTILEGKKTYTIANL